MIMGNPNISVLMSMYKGESSVRKMIECILAQTFKNFELILIDDGSPDRCGEIADEYAGKDGRIKVIHKMNGGLADARNAGLKIARGEYTIQFDQDDSVEEAVLKEMYAKAKAENSDMGICDHYSNDKYRQRYVKQEPTALDHGSVLCDIASGKLCGYCWNKLIRLDCYRRYDIQFPLDIYGCEDQYAMCELLKNDIKISYLPKAYCHYFYTPDSLSRHYDMGTYYNDLKIKTKFTSLLSGTDAAKYYDGDMYVLFRAFTFGQKIYSSKTFEQLFGNYMDVIKRSDWTVSRKIQYTLSIRGYYSIVRRCYGYMFYCKQILKKYIC